MELARGCDGDCASETEERSDEAERAGGARREKGRLAAAALGCLWGGRGPLQITPYCAKIGMLTSRKHAVKFLAQYVLSLAGVWGLGARSARPRPGCGAWSARLAYGAAQADY